MEDDEKIRFYEIEIKNIDERTFLNIVDITSLIKNHQQQCDMAYQDAIEMNYSHE